MSTLHFLNYNNYQNRTLKGENLTSTDSYTIGRSYSGLNFDIKDGVDTVHVINDLTTIPLLTKFDYDYCLVTEDGSKTILSKWFVMDAVWNRKHQWIVSLRRDVKADFYNMYKGKEFYCTKGLPASASDILCLNSEGKQFNQVLRERIPLKQDNSQSQRYIIGFIDKKWAGGYVVKDQYVASYDSIEEIPIFKYLNDTLTSGKYQKYVYSEAIMIGINSPAPSSPATTARGPWFEAGIPCSSGYSVLSVAKGGFASSDCGYDELNNGIWGNAAQYAYNNFFSAFQSLDPVIREELEPIINPSQEAQDWIAVYAGKPILIGDKIYTFTFETQSATYRSNYRAQFGSTFKIPCFEAFKSYNNDIWYTNSWTDSMYGTCRVRDVNITVTSQDANKVLVTVPSNLDTQNPYNIFVIEDDANRDARKFVGYMAAQYGATFLYDVQLFPYTPDVQEAGKIEIATGKYLKWALTDSGFGNCYHKALGTYSTMEDIKVGANQHMCRIISPNGASAWEFNPAAIGGVAANSIMYEFTLIPFSSYLHIFPHFDGIYGGINKVSTDKEGETRGLVCTGPWSLPYSTDNWSTYQLNNSAYMDSFNRQIENMTTMQDIEREKEYYAGVIGSLQTGLAATDMANSFLGKFAAFSVGAIGQAWAADKDIALNERGRQETLNYTKDQFYNSLQNIKAQARPLAHNSSITIGNSYWPIVELYMADVGITPTPMRDYFVADLKVHGWTMGIKTTFETMKNRVSDTLSRYIAGHLLQVDNAEDTHIANEIMKELNKGVYIDHV